MKNNHSQSPLQKVTTPVEQDIVVQAAELTYKRFSQFEEFSPCTQQLYLLALNQQKRTMFSQPGKNFSTPSPNSRAFQLQAPRQLNLNSLLEVGSARLGTLPTIFSKLVDSVNNPYASIDKAAAVIATDPALSAKLLRLVNSPFYGIKQKVDSIPQAIAFIGMAQLSMLAMGTVIMSSFKGIPSTIVGMQDFWVHSISCGVTAKFLAERCGQEDADSFFAAGLLHDIGKLLLFTEYPTNSLYLLTEARRQNVSVLSLEKEIIGFSHEEMGAKLLECWNAPSSLIKCIKEHSASLTEKPTTREAILPAANTLSYALGYGTSGEYLIPPISEATWTAINISPDDICGVAATMSDLVQNMRSLLIPE